MTNKANKANDATNKANATPATNDTTQATPATPATPTTPDDPRGYKAFIATLANGDKAPSHLTPRDLADWFGCDDRKVRNWLRNKAGVYAVAVQGADGPRHMFATTAPATRAMFDAMRQVFDGERATGGRKGRATVAYTAVDWANL